MKKLIFFTSPNNNEFVTYYYQDKWRKQTDSEELLWEENKHGAHSFPASDMRSETTGWNYEKLKSTIVRIATSCQECGVLFHDKDKDSLRQLQNAILSGSLTNVQCIPYSTSDDFFALVIAPFAQAPDVEKFKFVWQLVERKKAEQGIIGAQKLRYEILTPLVAFDLLIQAKK